MIPLLVPALAAAGTLTWRFVAGARVKSGEVIAEIETDDRILEVASPATGILALRCAADAARVVATEFIGFLDVENGSGAPRGTEGLLRLAALAWDDGNIEPERVVGIAASFAATGRQLHPIFVRRLAEEERAGEKIFRVAAGCNRCAAALAAGWTHIRGEVLPYRSEQDRLAAELIEIDENLQRKALSPAAEAMLLARRKTVHERLYPHTRQHVAGGLARAAKAGDASPPNKEGGEGTAKLAVAGFAQAAGAASGRSARAIRRAVARAEALGADTLAAVKGTALDKGEELDALAALPLERRALLIEWARGGKKVSAKTALKQNKRDQRERELAAKARALPQRKYAVILCDLARRFNVWSRISGLDRAPDNHYPTMTFAEACALDVARIAAPDSMLVYWSTPASLVDDLEIMAEWGFCVLRPRDGEGRLVRGGDGAPLPVAQRYRSLQVWNKGTTGTGYWFRGNEVELVLVGARGNFVAPAPGTQPPSSFCARRGRHSEKPECVHEWIERLWPHVPKLELFARSEEVRPGWDAWGYEAPWQSSPAAAAAGGVADDDPHPAKEEGLHIPPELRRSA